MFKELIKRIIVAEKFSHGSIREGHITIDECIESKFNDSVRVNFRYRSSFLMTPQTSTILITHDRIFQQVIKEL